MSNITVSYDEIAAAATRLGAGREEITEKLRQLQSQIAGLVSSGFVTEQASAKFDDAYASYTSHANETIAELSEIEQFLHGAMNAMRELDAQIAARIH